MINLLKDHYGSSFEEPLLEEIHKEGTYYEFKPGHVLIEVGDRVEYMPILLSGAIKIMRHDEQNDEIFLYYIEKGDTCVMSVSCCLALTKSEIRAVVETTVTMLMVPISMMEDWLLKYKSWRNFVFDSYQRRFHELLESFDAVAFMKLDDRIYKYIEEKAQVNQSNVIQITHQQIAKDMHTSRVVISRLLKKMEKLGQISLYRNHIRLNDFIITPTI